MSANPQVRGDEAASKALSEAFEKVAEQEAEAIKEQVAKLKELAKVEINGDDVALVSQELELSTKDSERVLREAGGDLKIVLQNYINTA